MYTFICNVCVHLVFVEPGRKISDEGAGGCDRGGGGSCPRRPPVECIQSEPRTRRDVYTPLGLRGYTWAVAAEKALQR